MNLSPLSDSLPLLTFLIEFQLRNRQLRLPRPSSLVLEGFPERWAISDQSTLDFCVKKTLLSLLSTLSQSILQFSREEEGRKLVIGVLHREWEGMGHDSLIKVVVR